MALFLPDRRMTVWSQWAAFPKQPASGGWRTVTQNMASFAKETSVSEILASHLEFSAAFWILKAFSAEWFLFCLVCKDSQIVVAPTTVSPKAFYRLGNDSYKLVTQKMRWDEARRQCQADDAELASILNPITQAYITLQISKYNEPVWIGLNSNVVKHLLVACHHVKQGFKLRHRLCSLNFHWCK